MVVQIEVQRIEDGEEAKFLFNVWRQLCLPFRLFCLEPNCGGETEVIETPPVVVPDWKLSVAEECPRCGRRLTASLHFVFD
jgi:hypothetical protein